MRKILKAFIQFFTKSYRPLNGIKEWERIEGITVRESAEQMRELWRYKGR